MDNTKGAGGPAFYTVPEAARVLLVTPATLYRAIREDAFPGCRSAPGMASRLAPWTGWRPSLAGVWM